MSTEKQKPTEFELSDEDFGLLEHLLDDEVGAIAPTSIRARGTSGPPPTSFTQELFWMLDRATPGLTAYNVPVARRLAGPLNVRALEQALGTLVERHEALRTTFAAEGDHAVQVVHEPRPVSLTRADVSHLPERDRMAAAELAVRERLRVPFDLAHDFLFRALVVTMGSEEHLLLVESHHIVVDGWSMGLLLRELGVVYRALAKGQAPTLPPVALQFADYSTWERTTLSGEHLESLLRYWREKLADAPDGLTLPTDFPRPTTQGFGGAQVELTLPPALLAEIKRVARENDATLYMVLLAAYQTLLSRWSGQDDVVTGSAIAGRTMAETEAMIGNVANTLVLRTRFTDDPTFRDLLARVRETALGAYDHQQMPLEKLVLDLREGAARLSTAPLFQCVLTMQDTGTGGKLDFGDVSAEPLKVDFGATKFDLTLFPMERADGLRLLLAYRTDLFRRETAERFLEHLQAMLETAVAAPNTRISALPLMGQGERAQLAAWNRTDADEGAATTVVSLFEAQAARVPSRAAVVGPRASATSTSVAATLALTYQELNARANQLAHQLRARGVTQGAPVGLQLDRSVDAIVGLVGILKSGGAYVPLAMDAPASRLAQQLAECGARIVVTNATLADRLPSGVDSIALDRDAERLGALPSANPTPVATTGSLAYVLYTSGSTGVPKGVAVTHANVVHYVRAMSRVLADVPASVQGDGLAALDGLQFGMVSTLAADLGNTCLYPSLLAGGTLHVLAQEVTTDPSRFAEYTSVHALDVIKITPNHMAALTAGRVGAELSNVLPRMWIVTGGEALRPALAATLLAAGKCRLLNHYGPTETTVGVLTNAVTKAALDAAASFGAQTVPLGRPLPNTHAYVVDAHGNEQPVGMVGELLIGGQGVTEGYLKRPELTAERFVAFNAERAYRTGDRVRRLADGTIEFLGRGDDQVKVRGYRVELGEIERALSGHPGVAHAAVILRNDDGAEPQLVAYAVAKSGGYAVSHNDRPTPEKLTEWLAAALPAYMVPAAVVMLENMPLTPNGKLDRKALPAPDAITSDAGSYVAPRSDTEQKLCEIWQDVLKRERIGITDNFLTLGGHSLLAIRVLGRITKTFGVRLALRALFDTPTVEQLVVVLEAEKVKTTTAPASAGIGSISRDAHRIGRPVSPGTGGDGSGGTTR